MFHLFREYKLEKLADLFSARLRRDSGGSSVEPENWLKPRTVVVQTRGMAEYLRQNVAVNNGIAANLHMPFINNFTDELFFRLYGPAYAAAAQRSRSVSIRKSVMKLLGNDDFVRNRVPALKKYIVPGNAELKRWQLAGKIAELFEQYQIYRANQLEETFAISGNGSWQKELYNELFNSRNPGRDSFFRKFLQEDLTGDRKAVLPEAFSVFGVGTMPPVFLDIFVKIAGVSDVDFFYLTPCLEFWLDGANSSQSRPEPWEYTESVNPILQSLGGMARGFFSAVMANEETVNQIGPTEVFSPDEDLDGKNMLEVMQFDIVHMFDRREASDGEDQNVRELLGKPLPELSGDNSVAIHNCHNLRRELEVLHDELLKLIRQGIQPRNIIVLIPDIVSSAPLIEAVFSSGELRDVYSIADLPPGGTVAASETFHRILETASGRFEYSSIISLMDMPLIRKVLGVDEKELGKYCEIIFSAGARWGFDQSTREKFCQNPFNEYSWQSAFDRLLGGYLCRTEEGKLGSILDGNISILPALEGSEIVMLAQIVHFMEKLHDLGTQLAQSRKLEEWCHIFGKVLDDFFLQDNDSRTALVPLRMALDELLSMAKENVAVGTYPLNAALAMFDDSIPSAGESGRFLRGKITFCRMMPMRSVPNDVVAILDLHEGDFPRRSNEVGFDLISALPQGGDRNLTAQDRYLLLEALLAARKHLLLFYQGQDANGKQARPACAPLDDIARYLHNAFGLKEFKHKLSGMDVFYFSGDHPCRSLNMENFEALQATYNIRRTVDFSRHLPDEIQGLDVTKPLTLEELITFFRNPCRWSVRNQFELYWQKDDEKISSDEEMWSVGNLERWQLNVMLIEQHLLNTPDEKIYQFARGGNFLPPAGVGRQAFELLRGTVKPLPGIWTDFLRNMERRAVACCVGENSKISGKVLMTPDGSTVLSFRWGSYDSRTALPAVLGQLCAAAAWDIPVKAEMLNMLKDGSYEQRFIQEISPDDARQKLQELLAIAGEKRTLPLPVFEKSSTLYYDEKSAREKFQRGKFNNGDLADPSVNLFYTFEHWSQPDFIDEFKEYASMLYSNIELRLEPEDE